MATTVDELTVTYLEDGKEVTKELDKVVLSKGAWSTIIYKFVTWDNKKSAYGTPKYTIRRYQKRNGEYQLKSRFNISSNDQAQKIIEVLNKWVEQSDHDGVEEDADE